MTRDPRFCSSALRRAATGVVVAVMLMASMLMLMLMLTPARAAEPSHGIAMHGVPRHAAGIKHFPYVDPTAPKGGRLTLGLLASFDSLNPLTFRGESAAGIRDYVYESLLTRAADEPFSLYGLIAERIVVPDDRSAITFHLRPQARFSDGRPITAEDVLFSHALLKEKGWPGPRSYYRKVAKAEAVGPHEVRFTFAPETDGSFDREMPLILGLMAIVPRHRVNPDTFDQTTLEPPVGSGPYRIAQVEPGRLLVFQRDPDWWAKDLPVTRGRFNFDEVRHEYFREETALFEAFKSGALDSLVETDPVRWSSGYGFAAVEDGRIVKRTFPSRLPAGLSALAFNSRREPFKDARVREALITLFDFEWINRSLYGGLYKRTQSVFERSALSSFGVAADARERALLAPFPDAVRPAILEGSYRLPASDGSGNNRANQQAAIRLLAEAGWRLEGRVMTNQVTRQALAFDVLANRRAQERLLLTYQRALEPLGIRMNVRLVDSAQYEARLKDGDFDVVQTFWASSLSPGNEQTNRWGSAAADAPGARNYAGVKSPAVDAMIQALLAARGQDEFTSAARALDRVIRSGHYVLPLFHLPEVWVAHRAALRGPETTVLPNGGFDLDLWWVAR
jgi:peptide/nickel transport system substrate-binding protein